MAASSSPQAAVPVQPDAPPQTGVHELPDHLLVKILGGLDVKERCERDAPGPAAAPPPRRRRRAPLASDGTCGKGGRPPDRASSALS